MKISIYCGFLLTHALSCGILMVREMNVVDSQTGGIPFGHRENEKGARHAAEGDQKGQEQGRREDGSGARGCG